MSLKEFWDVQSQRTKSVIRDGAEFALKEAVKAALERGEFEVAHHYLTALRTLANVNIYE